MSLKVLGHSSILQISLRRFSSAKLIFNEISTDSTEVISEANGRPLIPSSLKNRRSIKPLIPATLPQVELRNPELERLRIVPSLKSFYGGNPAHEENLNMLNSLIRKFSNLPRKVIDEKDLQAFKFISFEEYKETIQAGTRLKPIHYKELTQLLHRLRSIDPQLMPAEVSEVISSFMNRSNTEVVKNRKMKQLDASGRAVCSGKRKTSVATVYLSRGTGEVSINGRSINEYFPKDSDRRKIAYPFQVVSQEAKYNVFAKVAGGGTTGQADAVMYGISKCLIVFNPLLKPRLSKAGLMTRDARIVERKKPGKVKARKSPTWVKR